MNWTADIFITVAFLTFRLFFILVDFEDREALRKEIWISYCYGDLIENLYQLLNTRNQKREITLSTNLLVMVLFRG